MRKTRGRILIILSMMAVGLWSLSRRPTPVPKVPVAQSQVTFRQLASHEAKAAALAHESQKVEMDPENKKLQDCWDKISASVTGAEDFKRKINKVLKKQMGEWLLDKEKPLTASSSDSAMDYFWRGLYYAEMFYGRPVEEVNDDKALELLLKASDLDKDNSAPLLFAAAIEHRRGKTEDAAELLERAKTQSKHFSSYTKDIAKTINRQVQSPSDIITAIGLIASLPSADYTKLSKLLREAKAYEFAEQLMEDGLDPEKDIEYVEYNSVEFAVGRGLIKEVAGTNAYPTLKDVWDAKRGHDVLSSLGMITQIEKSCDLNELKDAVEAYRTYDYK